MDIRDAAKQGLTITETAEELGISYDAVRGRASRAGVKLTPELSKSIRQQAEAMHPREAVDYLLDCLESLTAYWGQQETHPVDELALPLTASRRRLLIALYDADGRVVSVEGLLEAVALGRSSEEFPALKLVTVQICHLREALRGSPWQIKNVYGRGYRLAPAEEG